MEPMHLIGLLLIPFVILRFYYLPKWIAEGAERRGWHKRSWRIFTFIFGLLGVIVYWACVGVRTLVSKQAPPKTHSASAGGR